MYSFNCEFISESDFESAYQEDMNVEDKAYVFGIATRLRRILNWDPGDEKRMFERGNGPQIIREIVSQFYRWKESQSEAEDAHRTRHLVIFSLARLCLYYWILDSRIVAEIMQEVFECDGHFSSMFAHVVNRHDSRSLLLGQSSDYTGQKEDYATIFFLHHAHKERLKFQGVRFVDFRLEFPLSIAPIFLAAIYNKPNIMLNLLRFGAKVELVPNGIDDWDLSMVCRHLTRILWNSLGEDWQNLNRDTAVMSNTLHQVAESFRILLRAVPQIRMGELDFVLMKFEQGIFSGSVRSHDFFRKLCESNIVPKLVNRYLEPSDLSHLCRCVIRDKLNTSWNLPYGINLLPLPTVVKNYLSLLND